MRGHDDVVELQERARVRLGAEHVERRRRDLARAQCVEQSRLVDELPARGVDDAGTLAELAEGLGVDRRARLGGEREVQGQEIGGGEHLVSCLETLHPELAEPLARDERIVRDDAHLEPQRAARDLLADAPETQNAERLAGELEPPIARALPSPFLQRRMRLRNVAREREQQPDRVLGGRDHRRLGSVRDDDSTARRGLDIDVVDPDARPADHLQTLGPLDQACVELRGRADDDRFVVADPRGEIAVDVDVDVEALLQQREPGLGDRLADENSRLQAGARSYVSSARVTATPRSMSAPASAMVSSIPASAVVMSKTSK